MKFRLAMLMAAVALMLLSAAVWADEIILKDGTVYSGTFMRGDSTTVDFKILGRVESFKTAKISRIVFKESAAPAVESKAAPSVPAKAPSPPAVSVKAQPVAKPAPKPQVPSLLDWQ